MRYWFLIPIVILAITLAPVAKAQDVVIKDYGFYGAVDDQSNVINPATVVVEDTPVGFFTTANPRAYLYIEFETIKAPFEIIFEWVDPENVTVAEGNVRDTREATFTSYWAWSYIELNEDLTPGVWTVNVYYNNEKILEAPFFLQTPQNVVDRLAELTSENEKLSSQLESTTAQIEELQARNGQLESEISTLRSENNVLKNNLEQAQAENRNLSDKLAAETARVGSLEQQRLIFMVTTGVMAAVSAVIAVVVRRGRGTPATTTVQQPTAQLNYCPSCGSQLQYIPQYQKYWCPNEQKYI